MEEFYVKERYPQFVDWQEFPLSAELMRKMLQATVEWWLDMYDYEYSWKRMQDHIREARHVALPSEAELAEVAPWRAIKRLGKEIAQTLYGPRGAPVSSPAIRRAAPPRPSRTPNVYVHGAIDCYIHWSEFALPPIVMRDALISRALTYFEPDLVTDSKEDFGSRLWVWRLETFPTHEELARIPSWRMILRLGKEEAYRCCRGRVRLSR